MDTASSNAPRILILESDRKTRVTLRRYAVKGWSGASVQSNTSTLADAVQDSRKLRGFDVVLVGCDFSKDGSAANPTLAALRAIAADPDSPPVILLTHGGSEYTAVQAVKAGAFDYIPRHLVGREQIANVVQRALQAAHPARRPSAALAGDLQPFGYDMRRCMARHDNISVHVAFSAERATEVVLKILHRGRGALSYDRDFERFVDEFKLLSDIDDRAVARIYDLRVTNRYCYIAMEYFAAGHLGERLGRPLSVDEALKLTVEIAKALVIIHAAGIVHRDLKPGNVMLRADGTLALIDFGISQSSGRPSSHGAETICGTPYYMSPEQARGEPTDERTDLYALGVMLYQMLTGEKPYVGDTAEAILAQHCDGEVPELPATLSYLQPLIDRLLAKRPAQRLATARELIEAVDAARIIAPPPSYGTVG